MVNFINKEQLNCIDGSVFDRAFQLCQYLIGKQVRVHLPAETKFDRCRYILGETMKSPVDPSYLVSHMINVVD